ncbi:hypothetical protein BCR33DRAFT_794937 [Rhizoclosmatium globosum]|uniref:Uncharacterized protein n=1 Tax=Rhizoclosmatium globosum TaxID=329046 RepID=A0A1Y2ATR0_9FUNG|nr:hypothetical protein BCR33DRAFT_794937 [Rhizoclosmatium globosum]|eukprot:ORY25968.1 hypothetical protein BCR33DRAFT_794937 [Rhizoclosmatium globosum]
MFAPPSLDDMDDYPDDGEGLNSDQQAFRDCWATHSLGPMPESQTIDGSDDKEDEIEDENEDLDNDDDETIGFDPKLLSEYCCVACPAPHNQF